ncbi:MAG TPA: hypothetical protein VN660_13725 [Steroidobacteraceae bacterium]|nr:hypothetical protein [Steroidobacteraceae bacterium]
MTAPVESNSDRAIGRLEGVQEQIGVRLERIEEDLAHVVSWVNRQRGGKATLTAMLTAAGGLGAAIAEIVHWIVRTGHK